MWHQSKKEKKHLTNSELAQKEVEGLPTRQRLTEKEDRVNYSLMTACGGATFTHFSQTNTHLSSSLGQESWIIPAPT